MKRLLSSSPGRRVLQLHDVTPRDGLQNEARALSLQQKLALVKNSARYSPNGIEVCSFVRGDRVPNLAGAGELCQALAQDEDFMQFQRSATVAALVPNMKGFDSFLKHTNVLNTVVVLVSCTDTHSKSNVNMTMDQALQSTLDIVRVAKQEQVRVRAYASLAFGCPFEGSVPEERVVDLCLRYRDAGVDKIVLADTLGCGLPEQVSSLLAKLISKGFNPETDLGMHMHDSHGKAHLNVQRGFELGVNDFDASVGGCGGCNFAPGSKGNISIEKLWRTLGFGSKRQWTQLGETNARLGEALQVKLDT